MNGREDLLHFYSMEGKGCVVVSGQKILFVIKNGFAWGNKGWVVWKD